jgi:hypothetical protein
MFDAVNAYGRRRRRAEPRRKEIGRERIRDSGVGKQSIKGENERRMGLT